MDCPEHPPARKPTHTPYDGTSKLFTIGLKPLDLDAWIEVDEYLLPYLAEKRRLYAAIPEKVFVEEDETRDAQLEVLELLGAHLIAKFPATHRAGDSGIEVIGAPGNSRAIEITSDLGAAPL